MFGFSTMIPGTVSIRKLLLAFFLFSLPYGFAEEFWARRWHASIIVGNWIYIDGGEIAYVGNSSLGEKKYHRENITSGLDLSKDWTNSSVTLIRTVRPSDSIALNSESLWHDEKHDIIYCFGGDINGEGGLTVPHDSIWGFKPNGGGGGAWSEVLGPTSATPFPHNIHRISTGTSAYDGRSAYYLGGFASSDTSIFFPFGRFQSSGLLTFDFDTLLMTNSSGGDYTNAVWGGSLINRGAMLNIPTFNDNNLLIILARGSDPDFAFNNVTLFDKKNQNWYSQLTSGDIPDPRSNFCAVGIQEEGTLNFEIFIYGGVVNDVVGSKNVNSGQVYILSLPSFRWFLANYTTTSSRAAHTCHATNSSQMIIIGGMDPTYSLDTLRNNDEKDPWTQGIGVFNMTALQFKDSYQANAEPYKTPDIIRRFYSIGGNNYPSWTSTAVKEFFEIKSNKTSNTTNPTTSNSTAQPNPSHSTISASPSRSQLSRGAISGLVVGCIATMGLCAIGAMYIVRRKSKNRKSFNSVPIFERDLQELPVEERTQEVHGQSRDPAELPNTSKRLPVEMSANAPSAAELSVVRHV